jgi:hypothetical protein
MRLSLTLRQTAWMLNALRTAESKGQGMDDSRRIDRTLIQCFAMQWLAHAKPDDTNLNSRDMEEVVRVVREEHECPLKVGAGWQVVPDAVLPSHGLGTIQCPFSQLKAVLGRPTRDARIAPWGTFDKSAFDWFLRFDDGAGATVYDYKASSVYEEGRPSPDDLVKQDYDHWHVGGNDPATLDRVVRLLGLPPSAIALRYSDWDTPAGAAAALSALMRSQ